MKFLGILIVSLGLVACGQVSSDSDSSQAGREVLALWRILEGASHPRDRGPYTYVTRQPIVLADGSQIVCVTTGGSGTAIWCKEVEDGS